MPDEETARDPFIQGMRGIFIVKSGSGDGVCSTLPYPRADTGQVGLFSFLD